MYKEVVPKINEVTCDDLDLVCIFPFPATSTPCWAPDPGSSADWAEESKHQVGGVTVSGIGTVGTVGWNHDLNRNCQENPNEGTWITTTEPADVEVDNFPVTADGEPLVG